jgi:hypothetical protein
MLMGATVFWVQYSDKIHQNDEKNLNGRKISANSELFTLSGGLALAERAFLTD